jgi:hypothetical protein
MESDPICEADLVFLITQRSREGARVGHRRISVRLAGFLVGAKKEAGLPASSSK